MISLIVLLLTVLSLNAHAETFTIYSIPYTYHSDIVSYAQTDQFVMGRYYRTPVKPVNSRGLPPLPTAVHRFNQSRFTLNDMIKYMILRRVAGIEGRSRTPVRRRSAVVNKSLVIGSIVIQHSKFRILTLHYPLNVYTLTPQQKVLLIAKLRPFKGRKLYVEGYTDYSGTKKYNDWLAKERAEAVVAFLNRHGFKAVELPSYGKYRMLKTAQESRRVEVYVEK